MPHFYQNKLDLNQDEINTLFEVYKNNTFHDLRQRAHLLILYNKGLSIDDIGQSLFLEINYILIYIKAWLHFGFEGIFENDLGKLVNEINSIEKPVPVEEESSPEVIEEAEEEKTQINPNPDYLKLIKYTLGKVYQKIEKVILFILSLPLSFLIWAATSLDAIDFSKFYAPWFTGIKNELNIRKNSNGNIIFQIINLNSEKVTNRVASSLEDTKDVLQEILQNQEDLQSESKSTALFLSIYDIIQKIQNKERRKRYLAIFITAAAVYIYYHTTIKTGIVILTILGSSITLMDLSKGNSQKKENNIVSDPISHTSIIDSILSKAARNQEEKSRIQDSIKLQEEKSRIQDSILKKHRADSIANLEIIKENLDCLYLAELNNYARRLIREDIHNHKEENYYISKFDERFYLIIKQFKGLREAAFQRSQLVENGFLGSKIVEIKTSDSLSYGLTIHEFTETEYDNVFALIYNWGNMCTGSEFKPKIFHNSLCISNF